MRRTFDFAGTWEVPATPAAVHDTLVDLEHYPQWWPQVVAVASLGPDEARVLCRSSLPYTLDLVLRAVDRSSDRLRVAVSGDLSGSVGFDLTPTTGGTRIDLTQQVSVAGALAAAAYVAGPVLRWNHDRMMRGCIGGLRAHVATDRLSR